MYYFLCSKRQAFRVDCLPFALCGVKSASKGGVGSVAYYLLLLCIIFSIIVVFGEKTRVKFWLCQKIIVPLHSQFGNGV